MGVESFSGPDATFNDAVAALRGRPIGAMAPAPDAPAAADPDTGVEGEEEPLAADDPEAGPSGEGEVDDAEEETAEAADETEEGEQVEEDDGTGELTFTVKVDGEELEVDQSELIAGYQRQADYTRKTQALSHERKQYEAQRDQIIAARQQEIQQLQTLVTGLAQFVPQVNEQELQELRRTDPAEWAARKEEIEARHNAFRAAIAQQEQLASANRQATIQAEYPRLLEAIPEWRDETVFRKEYQELGAWLIQEGGFTPEEWNEVTDHRYIRMARLAKIGAEAARAKPEIRSKRKVKVAGKTVHPGAKRNPDNARRQVNTERMERLRHTGHIDDAVAALRGMPLGGSR